MGISRATFLIGTAACCLLGGCKAKQDTGRPEVHPVRGTLFVADKPAAGARVMLVDTGSSTPTNYRPHATVEGDGSFQLTTFNTNDGAPVGVYSATVVWPGPRTKGQGEDEEGPDRLRGRYADPRRPAAQVQIAADVGELSPIRLK